MDKYSALIVEDSKIAADFLERMLLKTGIVEICANVQTAEEGLRVLTRVTPDVIILDLLLPGYKGVESVTAFSTQAPSVPIVVVTAALDVEKTVLAAGAKALVVKPIELAALSRTLVNVMDAEKLRLSASDIPNAALIKRLDDLEAMLQANMAALEKIDAKLSQPT